MAPRLTNADLDRLMQLVLERRIDKMGGVPVSAEVVADQPIEHYTVGLRVHLHEHEVTVAEVLNEGLGCGISDELARDWGVRPSRGPWEDRYRTRPRHRGDPQPRYDFECYQCGRPIANEHPGFGWKDHSGRTTCDAALLPQDMIDSQSYWADHRPKPFHGEEEDP